MQIKVKFEYATLLSYDEIHENEMYIDNYDGRDWWSRTVFDQDPDKIFVYSHNDCYRNGLYSPFENIEHIRPALKIPHSQLSNFKLGKVVIINDKRYVVLKNYLLANFSLGKYQFIEYDYKADPLPPPPKNVNYNSSYVKSVVDSWFNANFQDEVEVFIKE